METERNSMKSGLIAKQASYSFSESEWAFGFITSGWSGFVSTQTAQPSVIRAKRIEENILW